MSGSARRAFVSVLEMEMPALMLVRDFTVVEWAGFQFAAGFFNGPNRSHPGMPDRFVNTPPNGSITRPASPFERVDSFTG